MRKLDQYSIGIGDRFGKEGIYQLQAIKECSTITGNIIIPVWNKSRREHLLIGTRPENVRREADIAIRSLNWKHPYFVDADHININNVSDFIKWCDFFTIDVAEYINKPPSQEIFEKFRTTTDGITGRHSINNLFKMDITEEILVEVGKKYASAIYASIDSYNFIKKLKGDEEFIIEISMDESEVPQKPVELLIILYTLAAENIPVQTIAPRFSGKFNKGVDYIGDISKFKYEFELDVLVCKYSAKNFSLPETLKISVHSGSDKFSLYPVIREIIKKYDAGVHIKTAGTTWLAEVAGLALHSKDAFNIVTKIYKMAFERIDELITPYRTVVEIDRSKLPLPSEIDKYSGDKFISMLLNNPASSSFNPHLRQLMHISYPLAAGMGETFYKALDYASPTISKEVFANLLEKHLLPLFK